MATIKLTKSALDRLEPGTTDAIHWDSEIKGFGVKVTPTGRKVFLFQYRPAGRTGNPRKFTIGRFGDLTVEQARQKAHEIAAEKANGHDPQAAKRANLSKLNSTRFGDVCDRFYAEHLSQLRSQADVRRLIDREFRSEWENRSIHEIGKADVLLVLGRIVKRGSPIMANRALAYIRKLFNWWPAAGSVDTGLG